MKKTQKIASRIIGTYFNTLAYVYPKKVMRDAFNLFCTPFARKLKEHHQEFLRTGKSVSLDLSGTSIQTYCWGNGAKHILLVHGWASHSYRWKEYINYLVNNAYTVYAFDAPAHGNSSGKILNIIIYEKAIQLVIDHNPNIEFLMGHSIGGFASTYYLMNNPTRIKKAVILAAPGKVTDFFTYYGKSLGLSAKSLTLAANQLEYLYGKPPSYFNAEDFGREIKIPALIIHDTEDTATNPAYSEKLHKAWEGSTLKLTSGLGHELKSEELMQVIREYLT